MRISKHFAAILLAYIIWGFISFPLHFLKDYTAMQILFFRILTAASLLIICCLFFKRKQIPLNIDLFRKLGRKEKNKALLALLAGGVMLTLNWLIFIYAINHVSIQSATFAYLLCPLLTTFLAFFILKEKLSILQWISVGLSLVSCVLLGWESAGNIRSSFLIALTYALYLILLRFVRKFDRMLVLTIQLGFSMLLLIPFYRVMVPVVPQSSDFFGMILILSVVFTILPLMLNMFAMQKISTSTVGILMYINPLINFCLAFLYFNETATGTMVIAYAIIFAGLVLFNWEAVRLLVKGKEKEPGIAEEVESYSGSSPL
jgi:chloramphenicol-sensitive protein RarD